MAKDYFQDIVPPAPRRHPVEHKRDEDDEAVDIPIHTESAPSGKSIRNISAPSRMRSRPAPEGRPQSPRRARRGLMRYTVWIVAVLCVLLIGALLMVALRPTRVTVEPRTHVLTFAGETFTAVPAAEGGPADLTYVVETFELEDSEVVPSTGVVYAEEKATGNITVYNNFQTAPLRLVKDTRFETANGLIFRTPAEVTVPGKQGNTPGSVEITVVADQPGEQYNAATGRLTVPGLKSTPAMYAQVYAETKSTFAGGFVGERPGVAAGALEAAIASVRARLEAKARESLHESSSDSVVFPELAQIEYVSMPNTSEPDGKVRVNQKARVSVPVFPAPLFAAAVSGAAVDAREVSAIRLVARSGFGATPAGTSTVLGTTDVGFTLQGAAVLVWQVDERSLQEALAGKDKAAFEAIVAEVPAVQEASARIQPFWRNSFPEAPEDIRVQVIEPEMAK